MERIPITRETLDKTIHEVVEKERLPLTNLEDQIVEEIINSFPKVPTGLSFARWCKYTVNDLINKIPGDRLEDADRIKNTIGKEIRYILEEDEFDKVGGLIIDQSPQSISPNWMLKNAKTFFQIVNAGYRTSGGEVDWKFIVDKLGIGDRFKFPEDNEFASKAKEYADYILKLLEANRPEKFNPTWVKKQDVNLCARMLTQPFRDEEGCVDWSSIISRLPEEWKNRWEAQRNMSIERVAHEIKRLDEKYNPVKINQNWLVNLDPSLVVYVNENIRNPELGTVDWNQVLELLPQSIREKWTLRRVEWTTNDAIVDLRNILDEEKPLTLNPTWIAKKNDGVYRTIVKAIAKCEYVSWDDFIMREFPNWKEKYELKHREVAGNWHSILEVILEQQNPEMFSPSWIEDHDPGLYFAITTKFRSENQEVNWTEFLEGLAPKWKERFEQRRIWTLESAYQVLNIILKEKKPETVECNMVEIL